MADQDHLKECNVEVNHLVQSAIGNHVVVYID